MNHIAIDFDFMISSDSGIEALKLLLFTVQTGVFSNAPLFSLADRILCYLKLHIWGSYVPICTILMELKSDLLLIQFLQSTF